MHRIGIVVVDGAKAALESGYTITEAAERVGYGNSETLRRAFVARLEVSPSAYQQRFRSAQRRDAMAGAGEPGTFRSANSHESITSTYWRS